jgi:hypothetical protein
VFGSAIFRSCPEEFGVGYLLRVVGGLVEECHGCLGEVAAVGDLPFVVGLDQDRARQAKQAAGLGKTPTTCAAFDLLADPFQRVRGPDLLPMRDREVRKRGDIDLCCRRGFRPWELPAEAREARRPRRSRDCPLRSPGGHLRFGFERRVAGTRTDRGRRLGGELLKGIGLLGSSENRIRPSTAQTVSSVRFPSLIRFAVVRLSSSLRSAPPASAGSRTGATTTLARRVVMRCASTSAWSAPLSGSPPALGRQQDEIRSSSRITL